MNDGDLTLNTVTFDNLHNNDGGWGGGLPTTADRSTPAT